MGTTRYKQFYLYMCFFFCFFFSFPDVRIPCNPISPSCPVLFGFLKQFFNFFSQVLTLQPTDDEDNSSDLSMNETIQHDETQSTNPVTLQVSASVIHQASRSSTTSLLLDNSSTALSTPTIQTSTSLWLAAVRLVSHVFGVVKSGFLFGHNLPQLLVDADQGSELEQNLLGETESLEGSVSAEPSMAVESSSTSLLEGQFAERGLEENRRRNFLTRWIPFL